ncbi:F-box only protein 27 [Camelus dromedarius]|uniref:F-box only protein 27 n=1 Tax=Camelus dromedarius TaxID=9838 RepID=A0A5N4DSN4_CAMDR|nr:F-box only protein 27 [Camelus dromedarius]
MGLSQLPPELLLAVLSLLPPRTLLGRCRQVCRRWRALVDAPGLWLKILARDHRALYCYRKKVLDLEEEGLWPELLDSDKVEISVYDWRTDRQGTDCIYQLIVRLLDANQAVLDHFSPKPFPIRKWRNSVSHVFSNLKTGVRFVSFEHWMWDLEFCSEQCGVYLTNSSVIVSIRLF